MPPGFSSVPPVAVVAPMLMVPGRKSSPSSPMRMRVTVPLASMTLVPPDALGLMVTSCASVGRDAASATRAGRNEAFMVRLAPRDQGNEVRAGVPREALGADKVLANRAL